MRLNDAGHGPCMLDRTSLRKRIVKSYAVIQFLSIANFVADVLIMLRFRLHEQGESFTTRRERTVPLEYLESDRRSGGRRIRFPGRSLRLIGSLLRRQASEVLFADVPLPLLPDVGNNKFRYGLVKGAAEGQTEVSVPLFAEMLRKKALLPPIEELIVP